MKKLLIALLVIILVSVLVIMFDSKIYYKTSPLNENLVGGKEPAATIGNPASGVSMGSFKNTAFIFPAPGERIEILSVEKSKNVGIDIIYIIVKAPDKNAEPEGARVEFINLFSSPIGFVQEN